MKAKNLKIFFVYSLNLVLFFLSYIVPKDPSQVLLGSNLFIGNPKYFFLYLCKNKNSRCKAIWMTNNKEIYSELQQKKFPIVFRNSWKGFVSILKSKYLMFSHDVRSVSYFVWLPGKFNKIQMWHGVATKGFASPFVDKTAPFYVQIFQRLINYDSKSYHTIITCSEKTKARDIGLFRNKNVQILGFPRNDVFFDMTWKFEDYSEKYNLKKYSKILLFCPTWRQSAHGKWFGDKKPFSEEFLRKLNDYLKENNFILFCKKHNSEIGIRFDFPEFSNIIHISKEIDIQDLLFDVFVVL